MTDFECDTCGGTGEIPANRIAQVWGDRHPHASFATCPDCHGTGVPPATPKGDAQ